MRRDIFSRGLVVGVIAAALAGCGGGDGDDDDGTSCTPPDVSGTCFVSQGDGQVHGTGQLPAGVKDGDGLNVGLDLGNVSGDIIPDNFFTTTCGKTFTYTAKEIGAGTYHVTYRVYDNNSDATPTLFEGTSTNTFTITSNENVEFNPTF
jgi:hypothetical protein